jgi:hypothetical protein
MKVTASGERLKHSRLFLSTAAVARSSCVMRWAARETYEVS